MYYRRGIKEIVLYSALALFLLTLVKLRISNAKRQWLVSALVVSLSFWVVTNFELLLSAKFETFTFIWVGWIWSVVFVLLRPKSNFIKSRIVLANFIVFLTIFSLVEAPFHFRDISRGSQDSSFFLRLEDKKYFQKATEIWQAKKDELDADEFAIAQAKNELLSPAEEHGLVLSNIENTDGFVTHKNFDGDYIKIENSRRVTIGSTGLRQKRILVFGGSTIFCGEMPDSFTVPSQLQQMVLAKGFDVDVINFGIQGIRIENQFKILKSVPKLGPDDIVIFYDGVNDLEKVYDSGLYLKNNQAPWRQINKISSELENRSWFIRYLAPTVYLESRGIGQEFLGSQAKQLVVDNWFAFDNLARTYVEDKGATFVHILQPNLLTYTKASDIGKVRQKWSDMKAIENDLVSYATETNKIIDFTKILDELNATPFFDWAHLDETGNQRVAEEMFKVVEPLLDAKTK
jgi:lysophospholipase L1-like esterase